MRCNVHLASWLKDGRLRSKFDHLDDVNLDDVLSQVKIKVRVDYPLNNPAVFELAGPVTVKAFISFVAQTYQRIYREEQETSTVEAGLVPGMLNRNHTDGRYGIWGHVLGDLYLEGANLGDDGVWDLRLGS